MLSKDEGSSVSYVRRERAFQKGTEACLTLFHITSPTTGQTASAHGESRWERSAPIEWVSRQWGKGAACIGSSKHTTTVARELGSRTQPKPFPQDSVISANVRGVGDGRSLERGQRPRDKVWSHKAGCSGFSVHSMAHPKYAPGSNRKAVLLARSVLPCSDDSFARCGFL